MDVQHLEQEIQRALEEGAAPFMVSATAGEKYKLKLGVYSGIQVQEVYLTRDKYHCSLSMKKLKKVHWYSETRRMTWAGHVLCMEDRQNFSGNTS